MGQPSAFTPTPDDPYGQGAHGSAICEAHMSMPPSTAGHAGKPHPHVPSSCSTHTLALTAVPSGQTRASAGTAWPAQSDGAHSWLASVTGGVTDPPSFAAISPPHPWPSAPIRNGTQISAGPIQRVERKRVEMFMGVPLPCQ